MNAPAQCVDARPLLHFDLEPSTFVADWRHCDRIANYLAGLASFDRVDSFLYSNLFSTVLNELFEIVFCQHAPVGRVSCALSRSGATDRIELEIPAGEPEREFYRRGVAAAQSPEVRDVYRISLLSGEYPDQVKAIGLLELAADYNAQIKIEEPQGSNLLRLVVDVSLEGNRLLNSAPNR